MMLDTYRLLGCSGLRVSPMSPGTMTFGSEWAWGAEIGEACRYAKTMFGASAGH